MATETALCLDCGDKFERLVHQGRRARFCKTHSTASWRGKQWREAEAKKTYTLVEGEPLETCLSIGGVSRFECEYDKDGVCIFCSLREGQRLSQAAREKRMKAVRITMHPPASYNHRRRPSGAGPDAGVEQNNAMERD